MSDNPKFWTIDGVKKSTIPSGATIYNATTIYAAGNTCWYNSFLWMAKTSTTGNTPTDGSQYWLKITNLADLKEAIGSSTSLGRYLSNWNCITGKPVTDPTTLPYDYKSGDYYLVGTVSSSSNYKHTITFENYSSELQFSFSASFINSTAGGYGDLVTIVYALDALGYNATTGNILPASGSYSGQTVTGIRANIVTVEESSFEYLQIMNGDTTIEEITYCPSINDTVGSAPNYKPNGTQYTGAASTTEESETIKINDMYFYDGANWIKLENSARTVTIAGIPGLQTALDGKQSTITIEADSLIKGTGFSGEVTAATKGVDYVGVGEYSRGTLLTYNPDSGNITGTNVYPSTISDKADETYVNMQDEWLAKNARCGTNANNTALINVTAISTDTTALGNHIIGLDSSLSTSVLQATQAVAIGYQSTVHNYKVVTETTTTTRVGGISVGYQAVSSGESVAIGYAASCGNEGYYSVAIGSGAKNNASDETGVSQSIAIGANARTYSAGGVSIGTSANAYGNSFALGNQAKAAANSVVIGANACTRDSSGNGAYAIAIGTGAGEAGIASAVAIGANAKAKGAAGVVLGVNAISGGDSSIAIGNAAKAMLQDGTSGAATVAIGRNSIAQVAGSLNFSVNYDKVYFNSYYTTSDETTTYSTPISLTDAAGYKLRTTSSSTMVNRAINYYAMSGDTTLTFPTAISGLSRDFILRLVYTSGTLSLPSGITKYGDTLSFTEGSTYLITFTEIGSNMFFVKSISIA